jgi:pimeloyl-ACP methyl ester carboxylesterase
MTRSLTTPSRVEPAITTEDMLIASDTAGIELHVRNKRPASMQVFSSEKTILMMHGATYSSGSLFDVAVGGFSFMDYLAGHGYDVHAVDVRGYGGSTRPPEMAEPPENNPPIGRTETGVRDLGSAIEFILKRRRISRLNLVGMSWGGSVTGAYTSRNNDKVVKLALIAPQWLSTKPIPIDPGGALGAYRKVPVLEGKARWLSAAPQDKRQGLIPESWFEAWAEASLASDPQGNAETPRTMRATNGPILDIREFWTAGKKFYEPGEIKVPVLLTHAEWDIDVTLDQAQAYFSFLVAAPYRRWVEIGEGTHMVVMEKNRLQVFDAIRTFLDEDYAPEP